MMQAITGTLVVQSWTPTIGDPSLIGWATVFAYFLAALPCVLCAISVDAKIKSPLRRKLRIFWWCIAGVIVALGINKQLDLQTLLTVIGRDISKEWGWYEYRRELQWLFILLLGGLGIVATVLFATIFRSIWHQNKLVIAGLICLCLFIFGRASSFHHFDQLINFRVIGVRMNWILELGGIACIAIASTAKLYQFLLEHQRTIK